MKRPASVTMKDGRPVRIDDQAVDDADQRPRRRRPARMQSQSGHAPLGGGDRDDDAGEADHRADREVELAADHQERRRDGDDAELGRDVEEGDDAERREHAAAGGDDAEEDEDEDRAGDGARARGAPSAAWRAGSASGARRATGTVVVAMAAPPVAGQRRGGDAPVAAPAAQRMPLLARSITCAAFSLVTKPGPVMDHAARQHVVLGVLGQEHDRQVALQELLLVDREVHLAVPIASSTAGDRSKVASLTLPPCRTSPAPAAPARPPPARASGRRRCRGSPSCAPRRRS